MNKSLMIAGLALLSVGLPGCTTVEQSPSLTQTDTALASPEYWLKQPAQKLTLDILDGSGKVIRTFNGAMPNEGRGRGGRAGQAGQAGRAVPGSSTTSRTRRPPSTCSSPIPRAPRTTCRRRRKQSSARKSIGLSGRVGASGNEGC